MVCGPILRPPTATLLFATPTTRSTGVSWARGWGMPWGSTGRHSAVWRRIGMTTSGSTRWVVSRYFFSFFWVFFVIFIFIILFCSFLFLLFFFGWSFFFFVGLFFSNKETKGRGEGVSWPIIPILPPCKCFHIFLEESVGVLVMCNIVLSKSFPYNPLKIFLVSNWDHHH